MLEIEEKIMAWRAKMKAALPANPRLVDEFEDHLRESIAALSRKGISHADAFTQAINRIGDPTAIAFQYRHARTHKKNTMKALRIVATTIIGSYLLLMSLQFSAICIHLFQNRISPYSPDAPSAFFPNLLVCTVSSLALWLLWRKRKTRDHSKHDTPAGIL